LMFWPLILISAVMWSCSLLLAVLAARKALLPVDAPWWCRPLVAMLHLIQTPIRGWYRTTYDLRMWRPHLPSSYYEVDHKPKMISPREIDLYWSSSGGIGRKELLVRIVHEAKQLGWLGVFNNAWATWDVKFVGDLWHTLHLHTATEELGGPNRFTRARITAKPTLVNRAVSVAALIWSAAALISLQPLALGLAVLGSAAALMQNISSRHACLRAAASLVGRAGKDAGLDSLDTTGMGVDRPANRIALREKAETVASAPVSI
jgi:hypothetical protein